jgi:uncharacterized Fe-S cluster protein YjdI
MNPSSASGGRDENASHESICHNNDRRTDNCFRGLPQVFNPKKRPWVNIEGATTQEIVKQVKQCPSGALSYYMNEENEKQQEADEETRIEVLPNGPLLVYGTLEVKDKDGNETTKQNTTAFCRCGGSMNKPYCDGTHRKIRFKDE